MESSSKKYSIKHSHTQAQSTVAEGEKDSKSQRIMEYAVRIILLLMSKLRPWNYTTMPAQTWDEKGWHQSTYQTGQENFYKLQPYTKEWQTEEREGEYIAIDLLSQK